MGTPDFAVPTLKALVGSQYDLVAVVTQPDRPSGRGKKLTSPPVKVVAENAGIEVFQPRTLKTDDAFAELADLAPDLIVVAAFGQILRKNVLDLPPYGCINVHASLLPRWRGAAPVAAAIRAGDTETGVTIMKIDEGLDTGPIIAKRAIPITGNHTGGTLTAELAQIGAELLLDMLPAWLAGEIQPQPQDDQMATYAPRLTKQDGLIDWTQSAVEIERQIRAYSPWPSTYTFGPRGQIKILEVEIAGESGQNLEAGTVFESQRKPLVSTGAGVVSLVTVQPSGKRAMSAEAMINGQPELIGSRLGAKNRVNVQS